MSDPTPACREALVERIQELCRPLQPNPTGQMPHRTGRHGIRAVLFDVYGTLLISGSGDVGTAMAMDNVTGLSDALGILGLSRDAAAAARFGVDRLFSAIAEAHALRKEEGVIHPEVDIRSIWQRVLEQLAGDGLIDRVPADEEILRFAVEYECRVNPVWPMPGLDQTGI